MRDGLHQFTHLRLQKFIRNNQRADRGPHVAITCRDGLIDGSLQSVPESSQLCRAADSNLYHCGARAANELDTFIARRPVNCAPVAEDQYGRTVATCSVGGADIGEWLVRNGLALDWPQYSKGKYASAQREADRSGRGMWAGSYVEPWLFRGCIKAGGTPTSCSDDANAHP